MIPTSFYIFYILTLLIIPTIMGFKKADKTIVIHPLLNVFKLIVFIFIFEVCIEYILHINNSNPQKILSANYFIPLSVIFTASLVKVTKHAKISFNNLYEIGPKTSILIIILILLEIIVVHLSYQQFNPFKI